MLNEFGILHQRTCVYSSQQNGKVERKHRAIVRIARSLLFGANLPIKFWGEAILHATYILNRWPNIVTNWKTPYELLFKKAVDYDKLKTLGCLCYSTVTNPKKEKFKARAVKCIFLGYAPGNKGYKLYDFSADRFIVSRDVFL